MRRSPHLRVLGSETNHVTELQLGAAKRRPKRGTTYPSDEIKRDARLEVEPLPYEAADGLACSIEDYRRYVQHRTVRTLLGTFEPKPGLPGPTRASCPTDRAEVGCGFVRCRFHLARIDSCDRAGRKSLRLIPRDKRGFTISTAGKLPDDRETTIDAAVYLRAGVMPDTCARDVWERGPRTNTEIGEAMARHRTLVAREVKRALRRAIEVGADMGITPDDLMAVLLPEQDRDSPSISRRRR